MAKLRLDIVTAERVVFSQEVDSVVAPGIEGELGILPRHAPLLTALKLGELRIKTAGEVIHMAIGGGFLEVMPDKVVILADTAERAEEIDIARAQAARHRAVQQLEEQVSEIDLARAGASMARALLRLKVAERRRRGRPHRE